MKTLLSLVCFVTCNALYAVESSNCKPVPLFPDDKVTTSNCKPVPKFGMDTLQTNKPKQETKQGAPRVNINVSIYIKVRAFSW